MSNARRANCLLHKPWRFSTGPRTAEGKMRVRMNALKHGERSRAAIRSLATTHSTCRILRRLLELDALRRRGKTPTPTVLLALKRDAERLRRWAMDADAPADLRAFVDQLLAAVRAL